MPPKTKKKTRSDHEVKSPKRRPGGRKPALPWENMRRDYVEGIEVKGSEDREFPTLADIAEKYETSAQYVRSRSARERWADQKTAFAIKVVRERQAKRSSALAKQAIGFDDKAYKVGELGITMVTQRLAEIAQDVQRRRGIREQALKDMEAGLQVPKESLYSAVNYRELEGLSNAAARFQEIAMKALGTDVQKHALLGPDGQPLDMTETTLNIHSEITRDDTERVTAILASMKDAGLLPPGTLDTIMNGEEDIVDAEVVEEDNGGNDTEGGES